MRKEKINKFNFLFTVYNSRYYTAYYIGLFLQYYYCIYYQIVIELSTFLCIFSFILMNKLYLINNYNN